jgi:acyl-CoA synthetase (AMP-forming)/AMP-acid ligase II
VAGAVPPQPPPRSLGESVRTAAHRFGDRTAVVAPDGWHLSYRDLDRCSDEVAAGMAAHGVRPGDVVALLLPSSPDYLVAYAAAAKAGAVTAGINPRLAPPERAALLQLAEPALVVGTAALLDGAVSDQRVVEAVVAHAPDGVIAPLRDTPSGSAAEPAAGDPVAIVFTSGTTGTPRGAVFTNRHLAAVAELDAGPRLRGGGPPGGALLASTELVHVGVMTKLGWYLALGHTLHLLRRWRAADALRVIAGERITTVGAISAQVALMLRQPDFDAFDLSAVQAIVAGGGPSPPALVREARARFGAAYSIRYSSTESGGVGTGTAFDADEEEALHTVGRPRDGVAVQVRDADAAPVGPGETGTVWLRSPAVMAGYWRDAAATRAALAAGWLRTGDLGVIDDRGCLRLVGRDGDVFIRGGYNVHPQHVEAVLAEHPMVAEVVIAPRPDPVLGEVGVAVIVARGTPPGLEALRAFAAPRLARHELPDDLLVVPGLPRTAVDKVDRRRLAAMLTPRQASG